MSAVPKFKAKKFVYEYESTFVDLYDFKSLKDTVHNISERIKILENDGHTVLGVDSQWDDEYFGGKVCFTIQYHREQTEAELQEEKIANEKLKTIKKEQRKKREQDERNLLEKLKAKYEKS